MMTNDVVEDAINGIYSFGRMKRTVQYIDPVEIEVSCPKCEVEMEKTRVARGTYDWKCPKCSNAAVTLASTLYESEEGDEA